MLTSSRMRWLASYRLPFTWSHSRDQLFRLCQRQYYWRYYAPYGGNSPEEQVDRALVYILGRLTNLPALIGNTVHNVARDALLSARAGRPWEAGIYSATADLLLHRSLSRSKRLCEKSSLEVLAQTVLLREHYYQQPLDELQALASVRENTAALRAHPAFQRALAEAPHLMLVDEVRRFEIDGVPVFCAPDALIKPPGGSYCLLDWKTGSAVADNLGAARAQLALYALYLKLVEHTCPEAIHCEVVDLRRGTGYTWQLTTSQLEEARARVISSAADMKRCLRDINANQAVREDYPLTSVAGASSIPCVWCAYTKLCLGTNF